tara:strand:- start:169 stop:405 length:237 start_codon:yes stop_codon:yes gene_type:complete
MVENWVYEEGEECRHCQFWDIQEDDKKNYFDKARECRKKSPVVARPDQAGYIKRSNYIFPSTSWMDWCGDWEKRKEKK